MGREASASIAPALKNVSHEDCQQSSHNQLIDNIVKYGQQVCETINGQYGTKIHSSLHTACLQKRRKLSDPVKLLKVIHFVSSATALLFPKTLLLIGRPGGLGRGEMLWGSPSAPVTIGRPNIASSSLVSGGGMGYLPIDSSTRERPMLQMSDWTE